VKPYYFAERTEEPDRPWRAGFCLASGEEVTWRLRFDTPEAAREHCRMAGRERHDNTEDWPIITRRGR
jgi:hypothetical protein